MKISSLNYELRVRDFTRAIFRYYDSSFGEILHEKVIPSSQYDSFSQEIIFYSGYGHSLCFLAYLPNISHLFKVEGDYSFRGTGSGCYFLHPNIEEYFLVSSVDC